MQKYRKLIMAVIALVLLVGKDLLGIDLGVTTDQIFNIVVLVGGAFGVYQVENE